MALQSAVCKLHPECYPTPFPALLEMSQSIRAVLFTAVAIICSSLRQLNDRRTEVFCEALCWTVLPIVLDFARRSSNRGDTDKIRPSEHATSRRCHIWLIASGIAVSCLCRAEAEVCWILPVLSPCLLVFQAAFPHDGLPNRRPKLSLTSWPDSRLYGAAAVAVFAVASTIILDRDTALYSLLALLATFLVYMTLQNQMEHESSSSSPTDLDDVFYSLSRPAILSSATALMLQSLVFGLPSLSFIPVVQNTIVKIAWWTSLYEIVPSTSWTIAATIDTFSIVSNITVIMRACRLRAFGHVAASLIPLHHTASLIPKTAKFRRGPFAFWLISVATFITKESAVGEASAGYSSFSPSLAIHPIEHIIQNATLAFSKLADSQSTSYHEAHSEYMRRYGIAPPPGFKSWFKFAKFHRSPIIDDFDSLHKALKPFYEQSGEDIILLMQNVRAAPGTDLWHCAVSSEGSESRCEHPWRANDRHIGLSFERLLADEQIQIPRVEFLVNHLDEPAVLIPQKTSPVGLPATWQSLSHHSTWRKLTQYCAKSSPGAPPLAGGKHYSPRAMFVQNLSSSQDLCQHPEYARHHGLFVSPVSVQLVEASVPILSTGSLSTMNDVLFPSPAYAESDFAYDQSSDREWERKSNNLHWAGSTTGGYAHNDDWRNFQRQRFASLAQNLEKRRHSYLHVENGIVKVVDSGFFNPRLYDVAITKIFQCSKKQCSDQNAYFRKAGWVDGHHGLRSKFVFDVDGNGISGRFYRLLASRSVPLKQTVFREWHDDRLVPWVHYVPVSLGMQELPELMSYLALSESGQRRAREIAEQGRDWHSRALREVDRSIYLYRLLLEMARLQDPARKAGEPQ